MSDTVTIPRAEYEALLTRVEDAEDAAAVAAFRAREETLGKAAARADYLDAALVNRLIEGEHPVRIWREHRKLTGRDLAAAADMPASYLSDIENGKKPGSIEAMIKLSKALNVPIDDLVLERTKS